MSEQIAQKLEEAMALIEKGWTQHELSSPSGEVCLLGAVCAVLGKSPHDLDAAIPAQPLMRALKKATGFRGYLGDWNDAPERTQAEVIEAFKKAAELARAEA